jgi:Glycosyltransferase family 87
MNPRAARLTPLSLAGLFLVGRVLLLASLPLEGLMGYSDLHHFFELARLPGLPFIHYWVEFPPIFPFLAKLLFAITSGREPAFAMLAAIIFSLAQAGCVYFFAKLDQWINDIESPGLASWILIAVFSGLPYGWWYFDPLSLLAMLWGTWLVLKDRSLAGGALLGLGGLVKWFPLLAVIIAWRRPSTKKAILTTACALIVVVAVLGGLYLASPKMTTASLRSQLSKGSWETVWALVDGNLGTGNFGPESTRLDPSAAQQPMGNPARIPSWVTLAVFGAIGLVALIRMPRGGPREQIGMLGVAWILFLLWSPGWSPQWVLYLVPLILLALPFPRNALLALALVVVNVLEWPILLSRGMFGSLYLTISLRTMLLMATGLLMVLPTLGERDQARVE